MDWAIGERPTNGTYASSRAPSCVGFSGSLATAGNYRIPRTPTASCDRGGVTAADDRAASRPHAAQARRRQEAATREEAIGTAGPRHWKVLCSTAFVIFVRRTRS